MTLGEYIAEKLREALDGAVKDSKGDLTDIAEAGGNAAHGGLFGDVESIVTTITNIMGAIPVIGEIINAPIEELLGPLKAVESGAGKSGLAIGHGYMLGYAAWLLARPLLLPVIHEIASLTTNEIFDPDTAAGLVAKGIIDQDHAFSEASGGGLDNQHEGSLVEAARVYPDDSRMLDLLNRQLVTDEDVRLSMQRNGVPPGYQGALMELRHMLVSPPEIALGLLRGNITPEQAQEMADKVGVTPDVLQVLTDNTGEPPGLMQMLEAYRRKIIDQDRLERGIRQSRVRDEWIPMVEQLRYEPMTTADAARAVVENYMSEEDGAAIAQENGLLPEHWPYIVESWGRPLALGQMLDLLNRGLATEDQVKQAVRESDIKDKYVDIAVNLRRRLIPERQITQAVEHGVITQADAVALLKEQGFNDNDAKTLAGLGTAMHTGTTHLLPRSDVIAMYTDGLMNHDTAIRDLKALGYTDEIAGQMLTLADYKRKTAIARIARTGIEAEVKAAKLAPADAVTELTKLGMDHTQAEAYVIEWQTSKRSRTRSLTESQVLKATAAGIISIQDATLRLEALGLAPDDIDIIYKLEGFEPYTPLPTPSGGPTQPPPAGAGSPPATPPAPSGGAGLPPPPTGGTGL